jgi:histidyl-tRNA synthetase
MSDDKKSRPRARLPRGFRDRGPADIALERRMLDTIRGVYEKYGFDALETPFLEYTDALGKFLPDQDRPNEGVFSFQDEDGQWLSLRYDLTAPLARFVAENYQNLPRPFRRYQIGTVFRNEKPGPGRYREFIQCDADTVGSAAPSADAEMLMMFSDTLDALGLKRGEFVVKVNSRKLLDGVLEAAGVPLDAKRRGVVLRAIDKYERLRKEGVFQLLTTGRVDASGDRTEGAGLDGLQATKVLAFLEPQGDAPLQESLDAAAQAVAGSRMGEEGVAELREIAKIVDGCGYGDGRIRIDTGIVRGLDYYTSTVFEAQLTDEVVNENGEIVVFGSVGGGGRYDDLIARFTGQRVPAVGFSIGVSRLLSSQPLRAAEKNKDPLVVVTIFDKKDAAPSFAIVRELRAAGLRAEAYVGAGKMGDQLKYADKRGAAIAIIEGPDEREKGEVTVKDLALGAELAKSVESRAAWVGERAAQVTVPRARLADEVRKLLSRKV